MNPFVKAIVEALRDLADVDNAFWMRKYMREKYPFLGVKKPERHEVFKALYNQYGSSEDWFEVSTVLFAMPEREFQYVAMEYVKKAKKSWDARLPALFEEWIGEESWWDVVDFLGPQILGPYFLQFPAERDPWIQRWMNSENFWLQRFCLVFSLGYKDKTDTVLLAKTIQALSSSKEFFIQKAIGWALRQYARTDAEWVLDFVENNALAPLSKREALKHL
ncbi:DNA alkylation repair protein [Aquirufa sp. HETE-83D]|uniref:DNA alkylation repair protein n=1 Tax=Aquirufa esocilacus TaxID=3096513 RepID=A0ABW6DEM9_9BACT